MADRDGPRQDQRGRGPVHRRNARPIRVELEHRNLDRHGEGWESAHDGVGGDQGWPLYLDRFAKQATA